MSRVLVSRIIASWQTDVKSAKTPGNLCTVDTQPWGLSQYLVAAILCKSLIIAILEILRKFQLGSSTVNLGVYVDQYNSMFVALN